MPAGKRGMRAVVLGLVCALALTMGTSALAASIFVSMVRALEAGNAYIAPSVLKAGEAHAGDLQRLNATANSAAARGVPEKIAVVRTTPGSTASAASALRQALNFSGVVVVAKTSGGLGISSDKLSVNEESSIARNVEHICLTTGYVDCAIAAGNQVVSQVKSDQSNANTGTTLFWIIALVVLGGIVLVIVFAVRRGRRRVQQRLGDLRNAAGNTLSLADNAVMQIDASPAGKKIPAAVQKDYDAALALRDQAKTELDRGTSPEMLTQANQDAAQSVLGLQGVMRSLKIDSPLANPLQNVGGHTCFYCGRSDRPPYTKETITDDKGNTMQVEVCAVDEQILQAGRKPQIATTAYNGAQVPWWAVPGNPYYYAYGGPTWGYWLPFIIGMDMGSWYGGGWNYGPDWDGNGGNWGGGGADWGSAGAGQPSDAGGADWGSQIGGWDSGGGGDFGGGGDSGGGGGDWG